MERHRQARALDTFRKLRSLARLSVDEIAAAAELSVDRVRGFEAGRMRLKPRDQARAFAVLFEVAAARLRSLAPDFGSEPLRSEELDRLLEQIGDLEIEIPLPELPF